MQPTRLKEFKKLKAVLSAIRGERQNKMNLNELKNERTKITIAGEELEVKKSDPVKDTLTRLLQEKGIDSFTILVDGEEVTSTDNLPATFDGHDIEVERYVKAGC